MLPPVSPAVRSLLVPTVESELRRLIELSHKFQKRGKSPRLTVSDINLAMSTNRLEPIYGLHSSTHLVDTLSSISSQDKDSNTEIDSSASVLVEDATLSLVDIGRQPLPKCPLSTEIRLHWLAIEGHQPKTIDNPVVEVHDPTLEAPSELSREMQYLYSRIVKMVMNNAAGGTTTSVGSVLGAQHAISSTGTDLVCECLSNDIGLQELIPYFCRFIYVQAKQNLRDVGLLMALMHMCSALMANPHVHLIPCLHQLLPAVFTCVVGAAGASTGDSPSQHRWQLRQLSSRVVALMCTKYGTEFSDLYPRVCKTYYNAIFTQSGRVLEGNNIPEVNWGALYGGVVGIQALGHKAVKALILPRLNELWRLSLCVEKQDRYVSLMLQNAIVETLGRYLVHILRSVDLRSGRNSCGLTLKRRNQSPAVPPKKKLQKIEGDQRCQDETVMEDGCSGDTVYNCTAEEVEESAFRDIAEKLVPYYCAGSCVVTSCYTWFFITICDKLFVLIIVA